jgi:AraC family transcriptional regulator
MEIGTTQLDGLRAFCVHHVGPYPMISEAFERLGQKAGPAGLFGMPGITMLAIYHDDDNVVPVAELRSDAAVLVPPGVPVPRGLSELRIPSGQYASTTHAGPYATLGATWARFRAEATMRCGFALRSGPYLEIYQNTPADTPPDELRTELLLPIA